ncbi:hypothetical protein ACFX13_011512 [Malus domestica]
MTKKTVSKAAVVALAWCFFIIVFQISISSTSRSLKKYATTNSNQTHQGAAALASRETMSHTGLDFFIIEFNSTAAWRWLLWLWQCKEA